MGRRVAIAISGTAAIAGVAIALVAMGGAHLAFAGMSIGALVHAVEVIGAVAHVAGALLGAEVAWRATRSGIASCAAGAR